MFHQWNSDGNKYTKRIGSRRKKGSTQKGKQRNKVLGIRATAMVSLSKERDTGVDQSAPRAEFPTTTSHCAATSKRRLQLAFHCGHKAEVRQANIFYVVYTLAFTNNLHSTSIRDIVRKFQITRPKYSFLIFHYILQNKVLLYFFCHIIETNKKRRITIQNTVSI